MRYVSRDRRWRVDLIWLSCTSDNRDGEWLRVHRDGFYFAEFRSVAELAAHVDLAELEESLCPWPTRGLVWTRRQWRSSAAAT
jgi:hypothetical protein